jgi:arsenate reductase (glutaredoxin)
MVTIYTYSNCDSCRRATKWLRARDLAFEERPIRETPPSAVELRAVLTAQGGDMRKLFNTAGQDYRELKMSTKLPTLSEVAAIALLTKNGNLVKRPFLVGKGVALAGFDETAWSAAFRQS